MLLGLKRTNYGLLYGSVVGASNLSSCCHTPDRKTILSGLLHGVVRPRTLGQKPDEDTLLTLLVTDRQQLPASFSLQKVAPFGSERTPYPLSRQGSPGKTADSRPFQAKEWNNRHSLDCEPKENRSHQSRELL